MKERPILFSAPMVRALLAGTKTQTRRIVKPQWPTDVVDVSERPALDHVLKCVVSGHSGEWEDEHSLDEVRRCPYGQSGDQLWVKETHQILNPRTDAVLPAKPQPGVCVLAFAADERSRFETHSGHLFDGPWRPSIFMPRWASRIQLEITGIRVERLNDISEADASAEGLSFDTDRIGYWSGTGDKWWNSAREAYADLWVSINGAGSWTVNPWAWVIEFRRIKP